MKVTTTNRTPNQQLALDFIRLRKQSYTNLFRDDDRFAKIVLADLARFCRANASTFHQDPNVQSRLDGRREVWLRISEHLGLTDGELFERYAGGK